MTSNPSPNPASTRSNSRPTPAQPKNARLLAAAGALLILVGLAMGSWSLANLPFTGPDAPGSPGAPEQGAALAAADTAGAAPTAARTVADLAAEGVDVAAVPVVLRVAGDPSLPAPLLERLEGLVLDAGRVTLEPAAGGEEDAAPVLYLDWQAGGVPAYEQVFAVASRFDTIFPEITWAEVQGAWQGTSPTFTVVAAISSTLPALEQVLGPAGASVQGHATITEVVDAAWSTTPTLAYVPFDTLVPRLAVFAVDGQNPVENANKFDPARYPFAATLYAHTGAAASERAAKATQEVVRAALAAVPRTNRDPGKLTVLAMTGVTAIVRLMAAQMDERGAAWPAEEVGPALSAADITHISNEVPFVENCETDVSMDNFNFCTKMEYLETLRLSGVDIIGLTGNHQNDYGPTNALKSLDFYAQEGLPVYGGGRNRAEAYAPFYLEHNGNRLAFLGANSYGPQMAFATENGPGSAKFDLNVMSATIRNIKEKDLADVVLAELQYQESYDTMPLIDQRLDFNALVRAGADIVTGVQSHVPQAIEFTDGNLIMFGLGNLYFDQMGSTATRENMIAKHTFYDGRHISTQILTTLLYDYGQPRWTTREQREALLQRIFSYSYW